MNRTLEKPIVGFSPDERRRERLQALDGARGIALVLMLVSHSLQLFPGSLQHPAEWTLLNILLLFTKAATPLFVWVFGMTMAHVYLNSIDDPTAFIKLKHRLWKRALFVFLSFEFLIIVVEMYKDSPVSYIVRRMLYLEPGHWAEVLNFYFIIIIVSPWVLRLWKRTPGLVRVFIVPTLFVVGVLLSGIPVPTNLFVLKSIIAGYPVEIIDGIPFDTFPILQLSAFYLIGLSFGEYLPRLIEADRKVRHVSIILALALTCLASSFLLSGHGPKEYLSHIVKDVYRFPPQLPYLLFGLFAVQVATLFSIGLYRDNENKDFARRSITLLGRHSLFTFNIQYILIFSVAGSGLHLLYSLSLIESIIGLGLVIVTAIVLARLWEKLKNHYRR